MGRRVVVRKLAIGRSMSALSGNFATIRTGKDAGKIASWQRQASATEQVVASLRLHVCVPSIDVATSVATIDHAGIPLPPPRRPRSE